MNDPKKANTAMINSLQPWSNVPWRVMGIACVFHSVTETKITVSKIVHAMIIVSMVATDVETLSVRNARNQRYEDRPLWTVKGPLWCFFRKMKIIKSVLPIRTSRIKVIAHAWKIVQKDVHAIHMPVVISHTFQQLQRLRPLNQLQQRSLLRPPRLRLRLIIQQ